MSLRRILIFLSPLLLLACKPSLPKGVMSESKMVDILYDYHLAQCMPTQYDKDTKGEIRQDNYIYMQTVFKKHGVTEADFDSSMVFYCGDMKRLNNIFKRVSLRLERDASALGVTTGPRDVYAGLKAFGDTANVWAGRKLFAVKSNQRDNLQSWQILCDSSWLASDDVMWRFNSLFLSKDGARDLYAQLVVTYTNDSIRAATTHVGYNMLTELKIHTDSLWVPRSVSGNLFMPLEDESTLGRLCIVSQPMLIRFHKPDARKTVAANARAEQSEEQEADSIESDSVLLPAERLTPEQRRQSQQTEHRINVVKKKTYRRPTRPVRRQLNRR